MMSIWEIIMLLCFGAAWPFSIYKSLRSKSTGGKSIIFLYVILSGYVAGIVHKISYNFDRVTCLYTLNALMVLADIVLYYRNQRFSIRNTLIKKQDTQA
jgi:uncharacterized membrane protein YbjE (DUF340 family)